MANQSFHLPFYFLPYIVLFFLLFFFCQVEFLLFFQVGIVIINAFHT
jgi:hypothetical protein